MDELEELTCFGLLIGRLVKVRHYCAILAAVFRGFWRPSRELTSLVGEGALNRQGLLRIE